MYDLRVIVCNFYKSVFAIHARSNEYFVSLFTTWSVLAMITVVHDYF